MSLSRFDGDSREGRDPREERDATRRDELDALLDLDRSLPVPRGLAQRVLGGLREHEERALDTLLDLGGEHDAAPPGLAERVLARSRREARARRRFRWLPGGTLPRVAAVAAALALVFGAWRVAPFGPGGEAELGREVHDELVADGEAPAELLELLPVLERWDLLRNGAEDLDLTDIDSLLAVDEDDELLLLLSTEENG
jgi:hypothetical protein